ncbi:MAG TPA: histidine triad nucleotide-binding protein [Gemmatimonadales bacterium]|jgi:histidine triad (HIT) family protein
MSCIFCRIAAGEIPADIVAQTDEALAFRDLSPQAPVHVLVIPRRHITSIADVPPEQTAQVIGPVMALAARVAEQLGLAAGGYRLVANTRVEGGQTVDHLHVHLLGGRRMTWPPG